MNTIIPMSGGVNIPWYNTQSITNGIAALNRMYDSLPDTSPLKAFIDSNCAHLLKPLIGDTGIPVDYAKLEVLRTIPGAVQLQSTFKRELFAPYAGRAGVYVFYTPSELMQCGSCIDFSNRMQSHYLDIKDGKFFFGAHSVEAYQWVPVKCTPSYVSLFAKNHTLSAQDEQILTFFTQQEARSLEQAFTSFTNPSNYSGLHVNMWHAKWVEGNDYSNMSTGKKVTWTTLEGVTHTRSSIMAAASELGFSHDRISAVAKIEGALLYTDMYGPVTVSVQGVVKGDKYPDLRSGTPLNSTVDLTLLKPNLYYLFDTAMCKLNMGPYKTASAVNRALGLHEDYTGIATWCNYMHLINSELLGISVYICKYHTNTAIELVVTRLDTDESVERDSLKQVAKELGISSNVLKVRIAIGKPTLHLGVSYMVRCKHSVDQLKLVNQHNYKVEYARNTRKLGK
jgi:hypothetical protein